MRYTKQNLVYQDKQRAEIIFALRETLDAKGLNISTFARKYGYDPRFVNFVLWMYWDTNELPNGIKSRRILKYLQQELSATVID
jgi:hypothetical protein